MNKQSPIIPQTSALHVSTPHDSASKQVAGRADYVDDLPEPEGMLHAYLGLSTKAHAEIVSIDLSAVRAVPGVIAILTRYSKTLKEWAYAGFFFDFVLAALAHYFSGVPSPLPAIVALVLLMTSYALDRKVYGGI